MKRLFLTGALVLAAAGAQAAPRGPFTLPADHIGCATLAPYTELLLAKDNPAQMERLYLQFRSMNLCAHLPEGTRVTIQKVNGRFVCLRPVGWNFCGWTLLFDANGQVALP